MISSMAFAAAYDNEVKSSLVEKISVRCANPDGWKFETASRQESENVQIVTVSLSRAEAAVPPKFTVRVTTPQKGMYNLWNALADRPYLHANWSDKFVSQLAQGMPVYSFFDDNNTNRLTLALTEPYRTVEAQAGIQEAGTKADVRFNFFTVPEAPIKTYSVSLRIDSRNLFWSRTISEASDWVTDGCGIKPCPVPESAIEPLYSTWYQFHHNVSAKEIEEELEIASSMGMKTIILDDGWQLDPGISGYPYSGDWNISTVKFPDMASHVRRVQEKGFKYMVWYAVPFIGIKSRNYERFTGKYLYVSDRLKVGILDPRFPEVREFIIGTYEKALREWNLDGFKLDFIDRFVLPGEDPAIAENYAGRDIKSITEAEDVLMKSVFSRLKAIKPDILIEFRQKYIGQAIRSYGNLFRVSDCPADRNTNRIRIANLRIASGGTAVHSDMLEWNSDETPQEVSRTVLCSIFSVVQYSLMLRDIPETHRKVIRHWIDFSTKHRNTLLKADFKPYHPENGYPLIEASSDRETILGVYADNMIVPVTSRTATYILNATGRDEIAINLEKRAAKAYSVDALGNSTKIKSPAVGLSRVAVPDGGYLKIEF